MRLQVSPGRCTFLCILKVCGYTEALIEGQAVHDQIVTHGLESDISVGSMGAVNEATWKELVLDYDIPVLVDFWAPWCGPCRMIAPLVDELTKLYAGRVRCLKRNIDESPNKATEYGIRSIPTVLILKKGEKKDAIVGAVSKATLVATVEKYLDR
ncbi:hypothetical protein KP509_08G010500 [Ceratopteris richardii]|uniref:Thioredoxin domain-containing protein n=1 Tax=Ceratopteris richardii TaxID=49495 RepID=A0A8T2U4M3_CERRI|nr:hypothetical protein KP509_08G010500 [Ceratopteris richardii]